MKRHTEQGKGDFPNPDPLATLIFEMMPKEEQEKAASEVAIRYLKKALGFVDSYTYGRIPLSSVVNEAAVDPEGNAHPASAIIYVRGDLVEKVIRSVSAIYDEAGEGGIDIPDDFQFALPKADQGDGGAAKEERVETASV